MSDIRIVKPDLLADSHASLWPSADHYVEHGGGDDLWGAELTRAIVNGEDFAVGAGVIVTSALALRLNQLGFAIPAGATITAIRPYSVDYTLN